jgi:RNA polymerase sigma factor (sigma-70 family)
MGGKVSVHLSMTENITNIGFEKLLSALDADRERAGEYYELLRTRLIKFFEWRNCEAAEELADTVFDRIVVKIVEGEQIQNINAYAAVVAQFVCKEYGRRPERLFQSTDSLDRALEKQIAGIGAPHGDESDEERLACLDKCLAELSDENRRLVITYYETDERTMISARKDLAESMNVSLNTLRIRLCRLKAKLETCAAECCARD